MESSGHELPSPVIGQLDRPPWWKSLLQWIKAHKVKSVFIAVAVFFLVELLTIPFFGIQHLKTEAPGETALMRQRKNEAEADGKPLKINHAWIPIAKLPRHVINAVVVAEDGTFFTHNGFDWYEVQESIEKNIQKRRAVRGASTITQQLAKNLYLSTSKDPVRKAKEALITVLLERSLSKNRILELYLNLIEWGRGIFGIEAAARTYFGKSAAFLSLEEATRLAAVIPSPLRHRPDENSRYVLRRKEIVLRRMTARRQTPTSTSTEKPSNNTDEQLLPMPEEPGDNSEDSVGTNEGADDGL